MEQEIKTNQLSAKTIADVQVAELRTESKQKMKKAKLIINKARISDGTCNYTHPINKIQCTKDICMDSYTYCKTHMLELELLNNSQQNIGNKRSRLFVQVSSDDDQVNI